MRVFENIAEYQAMIGQEIGHSEWVKIDQKQINLFAEATGDHQWIHTDPERTQKELGMPTIAHGFLTLSLLPVLGAQVSRVNSVTRVINYGANKLRFTNMVPVNARVRGKFSLKECEPKAGGHLFTSEVIIEIENMERPALIAESLMLMFE